MKWILKIVGLVAAMSLFSSSALAQCTPVGPKEWTGEIQAPSGGWVSNTFFVQNGCNWNGQEAVLNGLDAVVFDMAGYQNLPVTVEATFQAGAIAQASGTFYNDKCEDIGYWGPATAESAATFVLPAGTKWMTAQSTVGVVGTSIKVRSGGATCSVVAPKPKKKKRR